MQDGTITNIIWYRDYNLYTNIFTSINSVFIISNNNSVSIKSDNGTAVYNNSGSEYRAVTASDFCTSVTSLHTLYNLMGLSVSATLSFEVVYVDTANTIQRLLNNCYFTNGTARINMADYGITNVGYVISVGGWGNWNPMAFSVLDAVPTNFQIYMSIVKNP